MDVKEIKAGDVFSEVSHYVATNDYDEMGGQIQFVHLESKQLVSLSPSYVESLLKTADSYHTTIEVGKEDKLWTQKQIDEWLANPNSPQVGNEIPRVGDIRVKGIRTIWEELVSSHVFTVCFKKADKAKTQKALKAEKEAKVNQFVEAIEKVKSQKKGVASAAAAIIEDLVSNPILPIEVGEDRILRGYKVQFTSRDGKYDCIDMDIEAKGTESFIRPVNINTIKWLVFDGVKYEVK